MNLDKVEQLIKQHQIKYLDLRFCDTLGKEHHMTLSIHSLKQSLIDCGQSFDGSSIAGWQPIQCSDMLLKPDLSTIKIDPFYEQNTLFMNCDVYDAMKQKPYIKCPRGLAKRAEDYLVQTGIGDVAYFGPEPEFFVFDSIKWGVEYGGSHVSIHSEEAVWPSEKNLDSYHLGHRPGIKSGYFPVPPVDSLQDLRSEICSILDELGIPTEIHHHEVASAGQCEVGTKYNSLVNRGDWSQIFRYVVQNVAHRFGKTATFMPKPIVGDNGSGMHIHQSIWKNNQNLFRGDLYAGLSQLALYYIGGIIKHAKALNAITNPGTNSYKRLVPGFEAPTILAYSAHNRSAAIRIPYTSDEQARRVEIRFPDALANPYLAFSALLMAGIDGIQHQIEPGNAMDVNLYELRESELKGIPQVCSSLRMALEHLDLDRQFLTAGDVFSDELIDSYIELKNQEVLLLEKTPHPVEFSMYYSL